MVPLHALVSDRSFHVGPQRYMYTGIGGFVLGGHSRVVMFRSAMNKSRHMYSPGDTMVLN